MNAQEVVNKYRENERNLKISKTIAKVGIGLLVTGFVSGAGSEGPSLLEKIMVFSSLPIIAISAVSRDYFCYLRNNKERYLKAESELILNESYPALPNPNL